MNSFAVRPSAPCPCGTQLPWWGGCSIGGETRRRNKLPVCIHFVWATKNRLPLIGVDIERDLYRCIRGICTNMKCECLAVGGMEDHVHLMVALNSTLSLGRVMKQVKGGSSRMVSERLGPTEWFAWQPNYAAFAVSTTNRARVVRYIEGQKQHHAGGTLWPEAEATDEEAVDDDP
ncbi:MAG TPA: IS200/IS605 family transposase [Chthonomonadaceae bacterium]|nr:IS200/IS605 family transposase [Chthonomonadaceae bacterium]